MALDSYCEGKGEWSEQDLSAEPYTFSNNALPAGDSGGGRPNLAEPGIVTDSDAFQSYILEMSQHRLISHHEAISLASTMAEAKEVMVEQLARVPCASRKALELCRTWIESGVPLSQLLDTAQMESEDNGREGSSAPADRQQLLSRIDSLSKRYEGWRANKTKTSANALARSFKRLGANIHLLRNISKACREMAVHLAPERAVGAAQALPRLEHAAGTDRDALDEVCRAVREAERRYTQAWKDMVQANLRLVISVARRFATGHVPLEDLVQEGNVGLFRAVEKYDHRLGYRFSTYASFWIRQAVRKALANQGRTMRVPAHMNDKIIKLLGLRVELQRELGRLPTAGELAARSQLPVETVELAFESAQVLVALDQSIGDDDGGTFYDITADDSAPTAEDTRYASELRTAIRRLLDRLPEREALILKLRHGIDDTEPMTLEQIAGVIGVSRERVRQLEARAIATLRAHIVFDAPQLEQEDGSQETDPDFTEE